MKKFKFKLQSVLDAREIALENCQLEMAKVQNKLYQANRHLEYLYETRDRIKSDLESLLKNGAKIDLITIRDHQNYIEKLKTDIINQHKIISDIENELEERKQEVLEAMKAKTMLEKLKEKALKEYKANADRLDLLEIDEMATNRQGRSR